MAEKISDDRFKSEVMRFIEVANQKFDGLTADVRTTNFRIDKLENKFDRMHEKIDKLTDGVRDLSGNVKTMSGQLGSALEKVMEHEERLDSVESRVSVLETISH